MTGGEVGLMMIGLFIITVLLGFPIVFTLMAMGVFFGYYAYATPDQLQHIFDNRIFDLLVQNTFSILSNDTLTAVPLFLFMGYVVERANILDRLFFSIQIAARRVPGSLAVATLITCALFATATGIVGAVVTLMGLLAFPAMLKAGYDTKLAAGVVCAGGCLGIMIPPSILLILYAATAGESVVKLYAGAFVPGFRSGRLLYPLCRRPRDHQSEAGAAAAGGPGQNPAVAKYSGAADLVLSAGGADPVRARRHPVRPGDADRGGGRRLLRQPGPGRGLSRARLYALEGSRLSDRAHLGDGDLPVRRLLDLRFGVRLSRRPALGRGADQKPEHEAGRVPAAHPVHHLPARLAAGMDRDHHHFRADLPAAVEIFPRRPDRVRHSGGAQHPDVVQHAADGDGRLLLERRGPAGSAPDADFRRLAAVRVHGVHHHGAALHFSGDRALAAAPALFDSRAEARVSQPLASARERRNARQWRSRTMQDDG